MENVVRGTAGRVAGKWLCQVLGGGREKELTQGLQKDGGDAYRVATDVGAQCTEAVRKNGGKTSATGNYDGSRRADPGARARADRRKEGRT